MASGSGLQIEDQTDEDFFDKLVNEELDKSELNSVDITRNLSSLSFNDEPVLSELTEKVEYSEEDKRFMQNENLSNISVGDELEISRNTENVGNNERMDGLKEGEASARDYSFGEDLPLETSPSLDSDKIKSDGSKVTSVKEVQWSAFSADDSQEFGNIASFEPFSEFIADSSDNVFETIENVNSNVGYAEQQDNHEQNIDQNDPKYWENLYPGWKYDTNTGQWYQVDNYDTTLDAQAVNSNMTNVESVSDHVNASYLQHTSHSVLESIAEENTVGSVSNWNNNSQGNMEYPSHMVFDPQYPEWYYDTNAQQWYPLESYSQGITSSSDVVPEMPQDMNTSVTSVSPELNQGIYTTNDEQYKLYDMQSSKYDHQNSSYSNLSPAHLASQHQTWDPSMNSSMYTDISQSNETTNKDWGNIGHNWNVSAHSNSLYSNIKQSKQQNNQFNMWQPQPISANAPNTSLPANQTYQPNNLYSNINQPMQQTSQFQGTQGIGEPQNVSTSSFVPQNMWKPQSVDTNAHTTGINTFKPASEQNYGNASSRSTFSPQKLMKPPLVDGNAHSTSTNSFDQVVKNNHGSYDGTSEFPDYAHSENSYNFNQPKADQTLQAHLSNNYYGDQNMSIYPEQSFESSNASQYSYALSEGRSSAGRPPHALVSFGFGGKLLVMKNDNSFGANLDFGNQENTGPVISVLNLSDIVKDQDDNYFHALCQPSFPGPLIGGNAAAKDVNKWIDERIATFDFAGMNYRNIEYWKLLYSLLKLLCQYYGKLRSPFGADPSLEETDGPESAVAKLFASAKNNKSHLMQFGSSMCCIQNLPVEAKIQATATEVQNLLVSGRRKDALQCAQDGQLWGPALVLASQLGGQFYVDTVKKMAQLQFASGSPLRTLCLLIAGQPADVFSTENYGVQNGPHGMAQVVANGMLDDWEENLAIITANRTKDDELVMIHLGDCLLKERKEIIAAHICYLVAEANFESYSDSARLCLIAADHWNCPRTYPSPQAIQRTEVYEYSKAIGNSQFVLQPFQPYKLVYAYMLAEIGRISESLKYCQASLKLLKNSGRTPDLEMLKTSFASLEERLRTHQQGGYSSNLAPGKLVNKLFTSIDRSIHRIIGSPPAGLPPIPPSSSTDSKGNFSMGPRGSGSQSTMAMSSLVPSASVDAMSDLASEGSRKSMHNRSISEPDFGRQGSAENKTSGTPSRFGRIGSQLFQKTIGWVSRSRTDHQAKLGESNKFYYDEKLKRWVEEGAAAPAEVTALPPPPTTSVFQNGVPDYNINNALKSQSHASFNGVPETNSPAPSESNSGIPPIPPAQNQFSARGRMGVRSRYVDTFNKGNSSQSSVRSTNSFHSPITPSIKPSANTRFFVPTAHPTSNEHDSDPITAAASGEELRTNADSSMSESKEIQFSSSSPPSSLQRFPSMDNIPSGNSSNGPLSRTRAASWSGTIPNGSGSGPGSGPRSGFAGSPPFLPHHPPSTGSSSSSSLQINGTQIGEELHEVEL